MYTTLNANAWTAIRAVLLLFLFAGTLSSARAQGCSQPSNLTSNVLASGTVALSWSEVQGALNYVVQYRLGTTGPWTGGGVVATPNQVLTNLLPERVYTWRVRASCSTFSSVATFNTGGAPGGNTACSAPSNLNANVLTPNSTELSWSFSEGALYYTVQYRAGSVGAWTNAGSVSGLSLTVGGLLNNTEYTWRVKASCSVYSSIASFNTGASGGGNTSCSQPSNLDAAALSTTSVTLSWSEIIEAFDYTVQYRQGLAGTWITLAPVAATSLTLSGLLENTEYSWQVKASCSDYSSQAVFTTGSSSSGGGTGGGGSTSCSAPSNTNTLAVFPTSANVEWEAQGGALNYTVQYRLELGSSTYTTVGTFTTANATITGLTPGRQYVWRVKANCSPYGSDNQFSTPVARMASPNSTNTVSAADVVIFPNPATADQVEIRTEAPGAQLLIMNLAGQVVSNVTMTDVQQTINVANFSNGVYLARVQFDNGVSKTVKLVVAH
jgi:Secretion system C-terminal sorting domain/Fibronectin type III domain